MLHDFYFYYSNDYVIIKDSNILTALKEYCLSYSVKDLHGIVDYSSRKYYGHSKIYTLLQNLFEGYSFDLIKGSLSKPIE